MDQTTFTYVNSLTAEVAKQDETYIFISGFGIGFPSNEAECFPQSAAIFGISMMNSAGPYRCPTLLGSGNNIYHGY